MHLALLRSLFASKIDHLLAPPLSLTNFAVSCAPNSRLALWVLGPLHQRIEQKPATQKTNRYNNNGSHRSPRPSPVRRNSLRARKVRTTDTTIAKALSGSPEQFVRN